MSVAAHHNDWLSLVEVSGPFLALPVLVDALPGGLDKPQRELTADLWHAFAEWNDKDRGGAVHAAVHEAWIRYVFEHVLEYDADVLVRDRETLAGWTVELPEHDASLMPNLAVRDSEDDEGVARLLVIVVAPDVSVTDSSETGWVASPAERMEALLKGVDARLGIVTNGDQWTLVHVTEGENTGFATWYASLWREEHLTLRAFITLLGMRRAFGAAENETLEALLDRSREDQQSVTTQLGKQVRRAMEILIQQIDRIDHDRDGRLLEGMTEDRLYGAAVTVMMRLIFLFYAEENDLLLLGDDFYNQNYAASTLREQLQATADESGEEILERLHDAWPRLLSTFRAVHAGVDHEQMRLPAYGGALFEPDRYPFLEGREPGTTWVDESVDPLPVDNRTVLHLLNAIQTLEVKVPGGARENRPVSFRALDVEQIGHVYETLLDHTAVRAEDWVVGLEGTKDKEPEVPLAELESRVDVQDDLLKYLKDETGRSASAVKKRVAAEEKAVYERWGQRWRPAFHGDESASRRAVPWGLLVRQDSAEHPLVVPPGRVYVTESDRRRSSGTHYTPRSLTEEMVAHALEPLVYDGPGDGKGRADWSLRSPRAILDLKVCDPACGSGAFLVQACRYLAERLVESWDQHSASEGPDGRPLPADAEERVIVGRRYIADRCLYGVDINPLATEMAKLSLWLITLQKDRPFTFIDHAIRVGDSLLGVTDLETLETFGVLDGQAQLWSQSWAAQLEAAREARAELRSFSVMDSKDAAHKTALLDRARAELAQLQVVADALSGAQLQEPTRRDRWEAIAEKLAHFASESDWESAKSLVQTLLDRDRPQGDFLRRPLHWPLAFPEVFDGPDAGFHAVVSNPPYLGAKRITPALSKAYRNYLVEVVAQGRRGNADLVAYFLLRITDILREGGCAGIVATHTLAEGGSQSVAMAPLLKFCTLYRTVPSTDWPGEANVVVAKVWLQRGDPQVVPVVDGEPVRHIGANLRAAPRIDWSPQSLSRNEGMSFIGTYMNGQGFIIDDETRDRLIREDPASESVIWRYLDGRDLTNEPEPLGTRFAINLSGLAEDEASQYEASFDYLRKTVAVERRSLGDYKQDLKDKWWQYEYDAVRMYEAIAGFDRVIALGRTTKYFQPLSISTDQIINSKIVVWASDDLRLMGQLASIFHDIWSRQYAVPLGGKAFTYSQARIFDTFPRPPADATLADVGDAMELVLQCREALLERGVEGLTGTYNLFHDPAASGSDVQALRDAHIALDHAVSDAYRASGVPKLRYEFVQGRTGIQWTLPHTVRLEVLEFLLAANRDEYQGSIS